MSSSQPSLLATATNTDEGSIGGGAGISVREKKGRLEKGRNSFPLLPYHHVMMVGTPKLEIAS